MLLTVGRRGGQGEPGWQWFALLSLALQGLGACIAKLVVTPAGPSALLLTSAGVQVAVGLFLAPPWHWRRADLLRRSAVYTVVAYATAGAATIGYPRHSLPAPPVG